MAATTILKLCLILNLYKVSGNDEHIRVERNVNDQEIMNVSMMALKELQELSDSGIYTSLSLSKINSASSQEGLFHYNYYLELVLSSPYFRNGEKENVFTLMVMKHLEDGTISFAIDNFPDMDDDAIEEFWIKKVEKQRKLREQIFSSFETEIVQHPDQINIDQKYKLEDALDILSTYN